MRLNLRGGLAIGALSILACSRTLLDVPDLAQPQHEAGPSQSTGGLADASTEDGAAPAGDGAASIDGTADAAPGSTDANSTVTADGAAGASSDIASSFLLNPAHTNAIVSPTLTPPLARIWSADFQGLSPSYPLIAGGLVYFVVSNPGGSNALVALDEHTGATRWGPIDLHDLYIAGHAYDAGRVFVASMYGGVVSAFDAATGAPLWTQTVASSTAISFAPPTAYRGILYVPTGDVVAMDEATGAVLWTGAAGVDMGSPAITDDGVFVSYGCGNAARAFDRTTGARLWDFGFPCDGAGTATPAVFDGRMYMLGWGSDPNIVLDAHTGVSLGTYPAISNPAFDDHRLFANLRTPLEAIDLATGRTDWTFDGDGMLNLGPMVANGTVYVASDDGMLFGADEVTGAQVWATKVGPLNPPEHTAAAEGVLVTTYEGQAFAYAHVDVPDAGVNAVDSSADGACFGAGPCLLPAEVLASGESGPSAIALDAQNLYWTNYGSGEVRKLAKSGGTPVTLYAAAKTYPWGIAVDANNAYWTLPNFFSGGMNSAVMSMPLAGGAATTLVKNPNGPTAIAVTATDVLWTGGGAGALWEVPIGGGLATALATGNGGETIAIDGKNVYWVMDGAIQQAPLSGGPAVSIGPSAAAIAVDATDIYFVNSDMNDVGAVSRVPVGGGTPTVLASGRTGSLVGVAVDDANVYWIEAEGTIQQGAVAAIPKSGGHVTILASGLGDPGAIAVDGSGVYFTNPAAIGGGQIMRVPKR